MSYDGDAISDQEWNEADFGIIFHEEIEEEKQTVIFTLGLPASGKSTWAKKFTKDNPEFVRVSRDDLRHMRGKYWLPEQEDLITEWERFCVLSALRSGYNAVVDATNLNQKFLNKFKSVIQKEFPDIEFDIESFLEVSLEECIERDSKRTGTDKVGKDVIERMYNTHIKPYLEQV